MDDPFLMDMLRSLTDLNEQLQLLLGRESGC